LEEEARAKEIAHDALINNERRAHANQVHIKLQLLREVQARLEEEARAKEIAHDALINNERRAHANQVHIKLQLLR
jgi:hypothetical protein